MLNDYRPGTLMYRREDGEEIIAQPHERMYSTVTMVATHHWQDGQWKPIYEDENDGN